MKAGPTEFATTPDARLRIVVVGSLNMDLVAITPRIPIAGETITGSRYFTAPGGKGANQAYAAAKLGGKVTMIGRVGDDSLGQQMRQNLSDAGCDVAQVQAVPGSSGVALICVSATGENSIVVVPGANEKLREKEIRNGELNFFRGELLLVQLETPLESVVAACEIARAAGVTVILDPAPAPPAPLPKELLSAVDIITPNETEACILAGLVPANLAPQHAEQVGRRLQALGVGRMIMKLGRQGCLLLEHGHSELFAAPQVKAIDTTAAGDAFNGALAVALSEGAELQEACRFAVLSSALSVTRLGAKAAAPDRADVEAFIKSCGQESERGARNLQSGLRAP